MGLRQDWRTGYTAAISAAVADAEEDAAAVLGLRWGALVIETVQQFNNDASYGQLRLVSGYGEPVKRENHPGAFSIDAGLHLSDVQVDVGGQYRPHWLNAPGSRWATSLTAGLRYGEPQYGGENTLYLETSELAVGIDWERPFSRGNSPLSWFVSLGAGTRSERLFGEGDRAGQRASRVSSGVMQAGAGIRARLAGLSHRWSLGLERALRWGQCQSWCRNLQRPVEYDDG